MLQPSLPRGIDCISVPTLYPVGPVNCYVLHGPVLTLVDCGPSTAEAETALRDGLLRLNIRPRDLQAIVLTHNHPDHVGGLSWLAAETIAAHYAHERLRRLHAGGMSMRAKHLTFFAHLLAYCGSSAPDIAKMLARIKRQGDNTDTTVDRALRDGDVLPLGTDNWQVIEAPGHAATSICLLDPAGTMLGGDTLLHRISSNALLEPPVAEGQPRPRTLIAYRATLERLSRLDISIVLPGHGPAFNGHADLIAHRLKTQDDRAHRILSLLGESPRTVHALSTSLFPDLKEGQHFLGLSEVLGHLDLLELWELAGHEGDSPALYYRLNR